MCVFVIENSFFSISIEKAFTSSKRQPNLQATILLDSQLEVNALYVMDTATHLASKGDRKLISRWKHIEEHAHVEKNGS